MTRRPIARTLLGLSLAGLLVASSAQAGSSAVPTRAARTHVAPAPARHTTGQPDAEWLMMGVACGAHNS